MAMTENMFEFGFMRHAFLGCFLVALMAGSVGWLLLLRRQAFAAHALPHIGFSGAAASLWLGFPPFPGMILSTMLAALAMIGEERRGKDHHLPAFWRRETMTGLVLAASLGLGVLCLHEAANATGQTSRLLFGDVLGLDWLNILSLMVVFCLCSLGLAILWRPLLFSSLSPVLAQARGVPVRPVSAGFMLIVALASSACSEVAGALLSFSLMIGPAASALRLNLPPVSGIIFSMLSALGLAWGGLVLSWYTDAPVAFWIGTGSVALYFASGYGVEIFGRKAENHKIKNHGATSAASE